MKDQKRHRFNKFCKDNHVPMKYKRSFGPMEIWQSAVSKLTELFKIRRNK